jgi:hypothetical protein
MIELFANVDVDNLERAVEFLHARVGAQSRPAPRCACCRRARWCFLADLSAHDRESSFEIAVGEPRRRPCSQSELTLGFSRERRFQRSCPGHDHAQEIVCVNTRAAVEPLGQETSDRTLTGALRSVDEEDRSASTGTRRFHTLHTRRSEGRSLPGAG